ncbi:MAG: alpha,alpha-trehalase TreF [Sphingopyxis sp.]|nr:alpha,alpha-trehalase TreF [Sphingopyxis sp.]
MRRALGFAWLVAATASSVPAIATDSPQQIYGPLFEAVQGAGIFPDSKTFVDAVPRTSPETILQAWRTKQPQGKEALRAFVARYFELPSDTPPLASLRSHIKALWPQLRRPAIAPKEGSSALALPEPYVVPGGRFREIYYWDSYFTMLGLMLDGEEPLARSMLANFESLIQRYGFIPNGTRSYYLGRSQPPFFSQMVDLAGGDDADAGARHLAALRAEHEFWMAGAGALGKEGASARVVRMPDGSLLNRYWDNGTGPRDESWAEDVATARKASLPAETVYRHLRAGAESGWDYSSRWLADPADLSSVRTTDIVPVDLNSLLWALERNIARRCAAASDAACAVTYERLAASRASAMRRYLWSKADGRFGDWDRRARRLTPVLSAATLYPLFVGLATEAEAAAVARTTERELVAPGGLRTTLLSTGQQWDSPNGWAPLQWIAVKGLERYGEQRLARSIASRWVATVDRAYRETGKMLEKYDVEELKPGGGGEYPLQDGFGWTNGVTRALLEAYPDIDPASAVPVEPQPPRD